MVSRYIVHTLLESELRIDLSTTSTHPDACRVEPDFGLQTALVNRTRTIDVVAARKCYESRLFAFREASQITINTSKQHAAKVAEVRIEIRRALWNRWPDVENHGTFIAFIDPNFVVFLPARTLEEARGYIAEDFVGVKAAILPTEEYFQRIQTLFAQSEAGAETSLAPANSVA